MGDTHDSNRASIPVVLVGTGDRAREWLQPLQRSGRLQLLACVSRSGESLVPDVPAYSTIEAAMGAHPAAAFAVALPPRAATEIALQLAGARRAAVIEAPLHPALLKAELGAGAAEVRVAHGWTTLAGSAAVRAAIESAPRGRLHLEVGGLPEADHGDLDEVLIHALALLRSLDPTLSPHAARLGDHGALTVDLSSDDSGRSWPAQLLVFERGRRMALRAQAGSQTIQWSCDRDRETLIASGQSLLAPNTTVAAPIRALAQLLPEAKRGDSLTDAAATLHLARRCLELLPTQLPPGGRAFRQSTSILQRRPHDLLAGLGLRGEPPRGGPAPEVFTAPLPAQPFELFAFRAGLKPVVFLTVRPEEVERTLSWFGDAYCERRERRVQVDAQDRWSDQREAGEPRVELYISRDPDLARRAAQLQADADPSSALRELGALVGYPPCCVDAFARQDDRANNSRNRYFSFARTISAAGELRAPWPWELNNLQNMIAPFFPCSYRCAAALAWVCACLDQLSHQYPATGKDLRSRLARPILYFDHEHQIVFDGMCIEGGISYRSVSVAPSASTQLIILAGAIALGNRLIFDQRHLRVEGPGGVLMNLERTDPGLGFIAPFGSDIAKQDRV